MEKIAVPPKEAFDMIGVGITKGYELINDGEFEVFKVGRATRVTTASVIAYVERQIAAMAAEGLGRSPSAPSLSQ